jgi:hypothetical protein
MEFLEIIFNYKDSLIEAEIYPDEDHNHKDKLFPIHLNGSYSFTLKLNEDDSWNVMSEPDGTVPPVEDELLKILTGYLKWEVNHVA